MVQSEIHCNPAHLKGLSPSSQPGLLLRMLDFQLVSPLAHTHTAAWCLGPSPCLHGAAASPRAVSNPPTRGFTVLLEEGCSAQLRVAKSQVNQSLFLSSAL